MTFMTPKTLRKAIGHLLFFSGPVFGLLFPWTILLLGAPLASTFGPIEPAGATRTQLVRWLFHRDLARQTQTTIDALADRYDAEFGRLSERRVEFAFPALGKTLFISSGNAGSPSLCERNIDLLTKSWFIRRACLYAESPQEERSRMLRECIADLDWWGTVHLDFLKATDRSIPNDLQQAVDFEKMVARFREGNDTETVRHINRFQRELALAMVLRKLNPIPSSGGGVIPFVSARSVVPTVFSIGQTTALAPAESEQPEPSSTPQDSRQ